MLEKYLWEELAVSQEGVVSAYVKPGPKAQRIKTDKITINIDKPAGSKESLVTDSSKKDGDDEVLKTLEDECFNQLKNAIAANFPDLKSVYLALPIECYREIAEKLPITKSAMLEIDQMTHFRFDRFGSLLLEVCKDFNSKRMNYLEDKQLAEMMAKEDEAQVFSTPSSSNPVYQSDSQRRSGWMGKSVNIGSARGGRGRGGRGGRGRGFYKKRGGYANSGRGKKRAQAGNDSFGSVSSSYGQSSTGSSTVKKNAPVPKFTGPTPSRGIGLLSLPKPGRSGPSKF